MMIKRALALLCLWLLNFAICHLASVVIGWITGSKIDWTGHIHRDALAATIATVMTLIAARKGWYKPWKY